MYMALEHDQITSTSLRMACDDSVALIGDCSEMMLLLLNYLFDGASTIDANLDRAGKFLGDGDLNFFWMVSQPLIIALSGVRRSCEMAFVSVFWN